MIDLARQYVRHANAHDLDACEAMFSDDARYVSAGVGEHTGRDAIRAMMNGFFWRFPDVHWQTSNWREEADGIVTFDFTMTGKDRDTGEPLYRQSVERICFNDNGEIRHIEVLG